MVRLARIVLLVAGALGVLALPTLAIWFGADLGYRYEVAAISIAWVALITTGVLLAIGYRRGLIAGGASG